MREFVQAISAQAKKTEPRFLVIPQGGIGLLTENGKPDGKPAGDYLKAIDGIGQEEIFYGYDNKDNRKTPKKETDAFLKQLAVAKTAGKTVLSIDYARKRELVDDAYAKNAAAGFLPFVADHRGLDGVPKYPEKPVNENADDVKALKDVKNFLYVIDGGKFGSKEKYLAALAKTNHDLLVIDLFAEDLTATADDLKALKIKANGGKRLVLCYVSIGEAEDYRFYWQKGWKPGNPAFLGPENPQWKQNFLRNTGNRPGSGCSSAARTRTWRSCRQRGSTACTWTRWTSMNGSRNTGNEAGDDLQEHPADRPSGLRQDDRRPPTD
jgi:cysteinyl-tRNA synthetase